MAEATTNVAWKVAPVPAGVDLRSHQYKAVVVCATNVQLSIADQSSGKNYVLMNTPNSGDHVALGLAPNLAKAVAMGTIGNGDIIVSNGSAGFVSDSNAIWASSRQILVMGYANAAANSGSIFSLQLV